MNQSRSLTVAVVGATGAVGRVVLEVLNERNFPVTKFVPFASPRSKGKLIKMGSHEEPCRVLEPGCFDGVDIAFFDIEDDLSKEWIPSAAKSGAWVVDNSAAYRMESGVDIIVPEANADVLRSKLRSGREFGERDRIISNPNCSTAQMVVVLKPIAEKWGLKRVVVSTYQSTSGGGASAMLELREQTRAALEGNPIRPQAFAHQIAFNCLPKVGGLREENYTSEETKLIHESRKILGIPDLALTATAVRVPTFHCHGESINIETEKPFSSVEEVQTTLAESPGIVLQDNPAADIYPLCEAESDSKVEASAGNDPVYVGRVRRDQTLAHGLNLWVVSDNLRKGAALNAVQIGEILVEEIYS